MVSAKEGRADPLSNIKIVTMTDYNKEISVFREFAESKLKVHEDELNTRYYDLQIDKPTMEQAYADHAKIFEQELKEKLNDLLRGTNDPSLTNELNSISKSYVEQLSNKTSQRK